MLHMPEPDPRSKLSVLNTPFSPITSPLRASTRINTQTSIFPQSSPKPSIEKINPAFEFASPDRVRKTYAMPSKSVNFELRHQNSVFSDTTMTPSSSIPNFSTNGSSQQFVNRGVSQQAMGHQNIGLNMGQNMGQSIGQSMGQNMVQQNIDQFQQNVGAQMPQNNMSQTLHQQNFNLQNKQPPNNQFQQNITSPLRQPNTANHQNHATSPLSPRSPGNSILSKFEYAMNLPSIAERCQQIEAICRELSIRDLAAHFHQLLNLIFCLDQINISGDTVDVFSSLCVGGVTRTQQPRETHAIVNLLSPDGIIFGLLHTMYRKKINISQEGVEMFKDFIVKNNGANFSRNFNPNLPQVESLTEVSAFELYFLSFAKYGLCVDKSYAKIQNQFNNSVNRGSSNGMYQKFNSVYQNRGYIQPPIHSRQEVAYGELLRQYMRFYLPLDLRVPTLIKNQSSSSNNSFLRKTAPATAVSDNNEPVHFSPIFKKNAFKLKRAEREILAAAEVKPMVSQSFVHGTVVENGQFVASLADLVIGAMMRVWFSETFWPQRTGYMLYEEHVRNLRLVVKHLISFVTIDTEKYQTQASDDVYHPEIMRILQNFQANVLQRHVQPKMYGMLSSIFECWSMAPKIQTPSYFRTIIELWLTYIQPWRYNEDSQTSNFTSFEPQGNLRLPDDLNKAQIWLPYITSNLECYTRLLEDILKRSLRVDLSNQQECTIIYRTLRVFSQKNLLPLIELAVENRSNKINSPTRQNTHGYKNSSFSQQSLHYNSNETESSAFHKTRPIVQALIKSCQEILRKKFHFYRKINAETVKKQSWMEWLSSFGDDNSTQKGNSQKDKENQQIANRLKDSIQFLSDLFNVDIPEVQITEATELEPGSPSRQNNKLGNRLENQFNDSVDDFAEFDLDDENTDVTLTSKGRDELMSSGGGKHAPITVKSHYDDLPCMSMEVGILLVFTQFFGNLISSNKKIETWLEKLEQGEPGVFNDYGRFWFMTAPNGLSYKKARISVRFLAHLSFWFYYFIIWSFMRIIGYSSARVCLFVVVLVVVASFVKFLTNKEIGAKSLGKVEKLKLN